MKSCDLALAIYGNMTRMLSPRWKHTCHLPYLDVTWSDCHMSSLSDQMRWHDIVGCHGCLWHHVTDVTDVTHLQVDWFIHQLGTQANRGVHSIISDNYIIFCYLLIIAFVLGVIVLSKYDMLTNHKLNGCLMMCQLPYLAHLIGVWSNVLARYHGQAWYHVTLHTCHIW